MGSARGQVSLEEFLRLAHSDCRKEIESAFLRIDGRWRCDIDFRTGHGQWLRLRGAGCPDKAEARGTLVDIVRRKEHEESVSRLAAIVASSDDAIVGETLDGIITDWNRGAEEIFGYKADPRSRETFPARSLRRGRWPNGRRISSRCWTPCPMRWS
jgi:two-component system sensor kinase FixL